MESEWLIFFTCVANINKDRLESIYTKSNKTLKTTHKLHNTKNTDCLAQIVITLLPQKNMMDFV